MNEPISANLEYKDSVFRMLYNKPETVLPLYSIKEGVLADFLLSQRSEVIAMSIFEYDHEEKLKKLVTAVVIAGTLLVVLLLGVILYQFISMGVKSGQIRSMEEQRQEYGARNRALCGGLRRIGWNVPDSQGTMFVWAKIPEGYESSADFCMKLMEKTGVIVTPGSAFGRGGEGYVRMALVVDERMIREIIRVLDESEMFRRPAS